MTAQAKDVPEVAAKKAKATRKNRIKEDLFTDVFYSNILHKLVSCKLKHNNSGLALEDEVVKRFLDLSLLGESVWDDSLFVDDKSGALAEPGVQMTDMYCGSGPPTGLCMAKQKEENLGGDTCEGGHPGFGEATTTAADYSSVRPQADSSSMQPLVSFQQQELLAAQPEQGVRRGRGLTPKVNKKLTQQELIKELSSGGVNPHLLIAPFVYGEQFGPGWKQKQPFQVKVHPQVSLVTDIHSHMSEFEVIGLLAGKWDEAKKTIFVQFAFPCYAQEEESADKYGKTGRTDVELNPLACLMATEKINALGLEVVGWYHSHPKFKADPSVTDCATQMQNQNTCRETIWQRRANRREQNKQLGMQSEDEGNKSSDDEYDEPDLQLNEKEQKKAVRKKRDWVPYVALIVGTYDPANTSDLATHNWFHTRPPVFEAKDISKEQRERYSKIELPIALDVVYRLSTRSLPLASAAGQSLLHDQEATKSAEALGTPCFSPSWTEMRCFLHDIADEEDLDYERMRKHLGFPAERAISGNKTTGAVEEQQEEESVNEKQGKEKEAGRDEKIDPGQSDVRSECGTEADSCEDQCNSEWNKLEQKAVLACATPHGDEEGGMRGAGGPDYLSGGDGTQSSGDADKTSMVRANADCLQTLFSPGKTTATSDAQVMITEEREAKLVNPLDWSLCPATLPPPLALVVERSSESSHGSSDGCGCDAMPSKPVASMALVSPTSASVPPVNALLLQAPPVERQVMNVRPPSIPMDVRPSRERKQRTFHDPHVKGNWTSNYDGCAEPLKPGRTSKYFEGERSQACSLSGDAGIKALRRVVETQSPKKRERERSARGRSPAVSKRGKTEVEPKVGSKKTTAKSKSVRKIRKDEESSDSESEKMPAEGGLASLKMHTADVLPSVSPRSARNRKKSTKQMESEEVDDDLKEALVTVAPAGSKHKRGHKAGGGGAKKASTVAAAAPKQDRSRDKNRDRNAGKRPPAAKVPPRRSRKASASGKTLDCIKEESDKKKTLVAFKKEQDGKGLGIVKALQQSTSEQAVKAVGLLFDFCPRSPQLRGTLLSIIAFGLYYSRYKNRDKLSNVYRKGKSRGQKLMASAMVWLKALGLPPQDSALFYNIVLDFLLVQH